MKLNHCEYDLETKFVESCGTCRSSRFQRKIPVKIGNFILYITYLYEIKNCLQGFTDGDFLYAVSLLPNEEQEVEIVQRAKYERQLHEQNSIEQEFEQEFMNTLRVEASASVDTNTSISADAGVNFLDIIKAGTSASGSVATHFGSSIFNETVLKTAIKVSRHYEVSIDTKTEIENQYRSVRKISNPNHCKVVTYFFKQLNKKFSITISLIDVKFDLVQQVAVNHLELHPFYEIEPRFAVAIRRPEILKNDNPKEAAGAAVHNTLAVSKNFSLLNQNHVQYSSELAYRHLIYKDVPLAKELSAEAFINKIESLNLAKTDLDKILKAFKEILNRKENKKGYVLHQTEYCVRTNSIIAEPKLSHCSICECNDCECEENKPLKELEMEKLKTEIELLKKQIEKI
jgi:hypothetical protein